jgi:hypothetical protein
VHALDQIMRDAGLVAGCARDVDEIDQQVAHAVGGNVRGGLGKVGMGH